jgi:molybdopterin synthase sulfur carrier subunit
MPVQVRIPPMLREATGGARTVEGHGSTVGAVLLDIDRQHPGFRERLFNEDGELRRFVNVYVNDEDIRYLAQLDTPVRDGDTVSILPAVAGGGRPR